MGFLTFLTQERICHDAPGDVMIHHAKVTLECHLTSPSICCLVIIQPLYFTPWLKTEMTITTRVSLSTILAGLTECNKATEQANNTVL